MSKSKIFKKNPTKELGKVAVPAVVRCGAGVGAMYGIANLSGRAQNPEKFAKMASVGALVIGLAGDVLLEEPHLRAAAQGIQVAGAITTTGYAMLPNEKAKFLLAEPAANVRTPAAGPTAGLGEMDEPLGEVGDVDMEAIARELSGIEDAEPDAQVAGLGDLEELAALAAPEDETMFGLGASEDLIQKLS